MANYKIGDTRDLGTCAACGNLRNRRYGKS